MGLERPSTSAGAREMRVAGEFKCSKAPRARNVIAWANGPGCVLVEILWKRRRRGICRPFRARNVVGCLIQGRRFALPLAITFRAVGALTRRAARAFQKCGRDARAHSFRTALTLRLGRSLPPGLYSSNHQVTVTAPKVSFETPARSSSRGCRRP